VRTLLVSSIQELWPTKNPVLFVDESCLKYGVRHIWENLDLAITQSLCFDQKTDDADYEVHIQLYRSIFPDVVSFLNNYHGVRHSDRYWRIVIDHWLMRAIDLIQMRYKKIEKSLASNLVNEVIVSTRRVIEHPKATSHDFYHALHGESDSALVNEEIVRTLALKFAEVKVIEQSLKLDSFAAIKSVKSSRSKITKFLHYLAASLNRILGRDTDAFFLNTYLPRFKEFLLQISFGQAPAIYKVPTWTPNLPDLKTRNLYLGSNQSSTDLENCVRNLVLKLIPKCYLEDYKTIDHLTDKIHWPKSPKFICTANDYDSNDFFKIWAAKKVEGGTPYYVIQHGSNFESSRYLIAPEIEFSNRYITWGWNHKVNCVPGFLVRRSIRRSDKYKKSGTLLIMASFLKSNTLTATKAEWNSIQISDQKKFLKLLNFEAQEKPVFRILRYDLRLPETLESWKDFFAEAKIYASIESSARSLSRSLMRSRVVVFAYFSTGFLECLAAERPVICFWQNDLNHFADCVIDDFRQLERVGLIHFTPESAANHINKHWDDILSWWDDPEVKCVRQKFSSKYARYSSRPVRDLKKLLG
jgi:putative transferase (TIGR04331 family)